MPLRRKAPYPHHVIVGLKGANSGHWSTVAERTSSTASSGDDQPPEAHGARRLRMNAARRYGVFDLTPPISEAIQVFLTKQGWRR